MKKTLFRMAVLLMTAMAMNAAEQTVTFNSQGGSVVASQTVTADGTVPYPEEPTKAGVYFDGWYKEAGCTNPCDYGAPVTGPVTLYAKWLTESDMIAGELGASVPADSVFEVNNNSAAAEGQPGWNTSWAKAVATIASGGNGSDAANSKSYVIKVTGNFQLAPSSSSTFTPGNIKVLIYAPANKTISFSDDKWYLLYAGANQTLILRSITLQGTVGSNTDANLVMRPGAVVSGGVPVSGGTFTMGGGTIYGRGAGAELANTAKSGASLAVKDASIIAKYDDFSDILDSGFATDKALVGWE
jgi:uncharacterized repeat protein (TIGR02543 family)